MHEGGLLMQKELEAKTGELDALRGQLTEAKARYDELFEENNQLRLGMHQILDSIREQDGASDVLVASPILERVVTALDARHLYGDYKPAMALKAQMERLEGVNAQLREQLRRSRLDDDKAASQLGRLRAKHQLLEAELAALKQQQPGGGGVGVGPQLLQPAAVMLLPAAVPAAAAAEGEGGLETAAAENSQLTSQLTNQLIHVLDELEVKDKMVKQLEAEVQRYSRDFSKVS
jgi:hypothetical protein